MPETWQEATKALPAPAAEPQHSSLKASKEQSRRKLTTARELLSKHTGQRSTPLAAIESRSTEDAWGAAEEQALLQAQAQAQAQVQAQAQAQAQAQIQAQAQAEEAWLGQQSAALTMDASIGTGIPSASSEPPRHRCRHRHRYRRRTELGLRHEGHEGTRLRPRADRQAVCLGRDRTGLVRFLQPHPGRVEGRRGGTPPTVHGQATAGTPVPLADIQLGDLILFYGDVSHIGFYLGNAMMIHAPSPGAYIREESIFFAGQSAIYSAVRPT